MTQALQKPERQQSPPTWSPKQATSRSAPVPKLVLRPDSKLSADCLVKRSER